MANDFETIQEDTDKMSQQRSRRWKWLRVSTQLATTEVVLI